MLKMKVREFISKCASLLSPEWLSLHLSVALAAGAAAGAAIAAAAAEGGGFTPREIMLWSYPGELLVSDRFNRSKCGLLTEGQF